MKRSKLLVALLATVAAMTVLAGCAPADVGISRSTPKPAVKLRATTTPEPGDRIAARTFIDGNRGWAVGTPAASGGSLIQRTVDGGATWEVQLRDPEAFPLVGVDFTDALHGWAVASSGTLVGFIIATSDGGRTWNEQGAGYGPLESVHFTDRLHGVIEGWDGDSPQRRITLETVDGGRHWKVRPRK